MSASPSVPSSGRFPARIGQTVVAPRAAAARIEAEGGSLRDALWLVVLGVLTFRLPELCRVLLAIAGPATGDLMRLAGLFLDETREAAWVVLPAAVIVTAAAGSATGRHARSRSGRRLLRALLRACARSRASWTA